MIPLSTIQENERPAGRGVCKTCRTDQIIVRRWGGTDFGWGSRVLEKHEGRIVGKLCAGSWSRDFTEKEKEP